ncbi:MAG: DUF1385 domain-containing protein [Candidatus Gastranaerophilales bacterium]|nr:DUF1385 domain-containing protein [Candidatus Gastranaerophilales bacterium]
MNWFDKIDLKKIPDLPEIEDISSDIPAVSEYLDAFFLPEAFKQAEIDTLPVINDQGVITGIVSEYDLAKIIPEWSFAKESYRYNIKVADIMTREVWTEMFHTNIKELLDSVHQMHTRVVPIVDAKNKYTGVCITRGNLLKYLTRMVKPRSLGGLATPIGVYLTDGIHQAGTKSRGLFLTGITLGFFVLIIQNFADFILDFVQIPMFLAILVEIFIFLSVLRITPLVRIHAAEHMTINAIEKGLPLNVETVRMQSPIHKRCGTNLMVLLVGIQVLLLILYEIPFLQSPILQFLFIMFGFLFIFSNWKNAGMWLQKYFTTAKPSDKQIENGIKAGKEILEIHKNDVRPKSPNLIQKIWNMGIFQILIGFFIVLYGFDFLYNLM